jgi:hypothetical protein
MPAMLTMPPEFVNAFGNDRSNKKVPVKLLKEGFGTSTRSNAWGASAKGAKPGSTPRYVVPPNRVPFVVTISILLTVFVVAS